MLNGTYLLKNPILFFFRPKVTISISKKKQRIKGRLKLGWSNYPLKHLKSVKDCHYFNFSVDIIHITLVINEFDVDHFDGFFDTPIGHFKVEGKRLKV